MKDLLHSLLVLGLLFAANLGGLKVMTEFRILESVLSPGGHLDLYILGVGGAFMILRFWLILLAPAMVAVRAFQMVWGWFAPEEVEEKK